MPTKVVHGLLCDQAPNLANINSIENPRGFM